MLSPYTLNSQTASFATTESLNRFTSSINSFTQSILNWTGSVITNSQTGALRTGRWVYDAELSFVDSDDNTIIERILEGQINVLPQVTS